MSTPSFDQPRRGGSNTRGFNPRGRGGPRGGSARVAAPSNLPAEAEDVKLLRSSYSTQLSTTKELFPEWSDEDILNALQEASGDVELTILRISEG
jgi:hypothetical protein